VRAALSTFLVDQLYKNVDVQAEIANTLPKNLKGFSGPASAVLHDYAVRTANTLLGSKATIRLVENATRTAHQQFISLVDDDPGHAQNVYLNLRSVLLSLAERVGLEDTVAQKLPPTAGQFVVLHDRGSTVVTIRKAIKLLKALSLFLTIIVFALYGIAVWLARSWRREALLRAGFGFLFAAVLVLVLRRVADNLLLDAVVGQAPARPAVDATLNIFTDLLATIAWTGVVFALITITVAYLSGPGRLARWVRGVIAPGVVRYPAIGWTTVGLIVVLILVLLPIDSWTSFISRGVIIAVVIGGYEAIRRVTTHEHPEGGWTFDSLSQRRRQGGSSGGASTVDQLERLDALRERGALTSAEYEAQKAALLGS